MISSARYNQNKFHLFLKNLKVLEGDEVVPLTNDELKNESIDFEAALKSEVKEMKSKRHHVLAIRNDVKGVVFFKAATDLDVDIIFEKLIQLVVSKSWKPK